MSTTWSHSSSPYSSTGLMMSMPALLTSTSNLPNRSIPKPTRSSQLCRSEVSTLVAAALPPALAISSAVCSACLRVLEQVTTVAPAAARPMAIALPSPRPDPVTIATFPDRSNRSAGASDRRSSTPRLISIRCLLSRVTVTLASTAGLFLCPRTLRLRDQQPSSHDPRKFERTKTHTIDKIVAGGSQWSVLVRQSADYHSLGEACQGDFPDRCSALGCPDQPFQTLLLSHKKPSGIQLCIH